MGRSRGFGDEMSTPRRNDVVTIQRTGNTKIRNTATPAAFTATLNAGWRRPGRRTAGAVNASAVGASTTIRSATLIDPRSRPLGPFARSVLRSWPLGPWARSQFLLADHLAQVDERQQQCDEDHD